MDGSQYDDYLKKLLPLKGLDFKKGLLDLCNKIQMVDRSEKPPPPPSNPLEAKNKANWKIFSERFKDNMEGSHILSHAVDLGYEETLNTLNYVIYKFDFLLKKKGTYHSGTALETMFLENIVDQCRVEGLCVKSDIKQPPWKPKKEGYVKPYNIRMILNINNFKIKSRQVKVSSKNALLTRRHEGEDFNFEVEPGAVIMEQKDITTMVLTLWIYFPEDSTKKIMWKFGTGYISDEFPFSNPDEIIHLIDIIMRKPFAFDKEANLPIIDQAKEDKIKKMIRDKDGSKLALLPQTIPLNPVLTGGGDKNNNNNHNHNYNQYLKYKQKYLNLKNQIEKY